MKKKLLIGAVLLNGFLASAQQIVATFDSLPLDSVGYWDGSDLSGGFSDGSAFFVNNYDTIYDYWAHGFAYTNWTDTTTGTYLDPYSTYAGEGYDASQKFAAAYYSAYGNGYPKIKFDSATTVEGFYVTNNTYAALSMKYGDFVGKIFGDSLDANGQNDSTNGEDWFKLIAIPYIGDSLYESKKVEFYLADYRFADNSLDYIVSDWRWFNLSSFGKVDSIIFTFESSDVGTFGINTPTYFCMDNFTTSNQIIDGKNKLYSSLVCIYPNPTSDFLYLKIPAEQFKISISDNNGRIIYVGNERKIDISNFNQGIYVVGIEFDDVKIYRKLVKK